MEVVERIDAAAGTPLAFDMYSPDIEWDLTNYVGWTDQPVYQGHDGVREIMRGWVGSFDHWAPPWSGPFRVVKRSSRSWSIAHI